MKHAQRISLRLLLILIITTIVSTQLSKALADELVTCQLDNKVMNTRNKVAGVAANSNTLTDLILVDKFINIVNSSGVKKTTRNLRWDLIEQTKGTYVWDAAYGGSGYADTIASKLPADTVIFKLVYSPKWASTQPNHPRYWGSVPTDMDAWQRFVTQAAKRYGHGTGGQGKVKDWEVWNEPNIKEYWWGSADQFIALNNTAYDSIKAVDSQAVVWGPAMIFWYDTLTKSGSVYRIPVNGEEKYNKYKGMWDMFYLTLEKGKFDGFSYHVYGDARQTYDITKALKAKLSEYPQHAKKKLMLSETNLNVGIPSWELNCPYGPNPGQVDEQKKRQVLQQRYACTFNAGADIVLWFPIQNRVNSNCPMRSLNDGVVTKELDPLPALEDLKLINIALETSSKFCPLPEDVSIAQKCTPVGYNVSLTWSKVPTATQYIVAIDDDGSFWSDTNKGAEYGLPVEWTATGATLWTKSFSDEIPRYFGVRVGQSQTCTPNVNSFNISKKINTPVCKEHDLNRDSKITIEDYNLLKESFTFDKHKLYNQLIKKFNTAY